MGEDEKALTIPDTPETRRLWLSDFREEELRVVLRRLLDAGFVQMTLKDGERAFRQTMLGRATMAASS
jgi:hypothetical protein